MGDGLKLNKDKRHKSSSSLAGAALEGTRSERKLDIRASIPEVDDQFALAEARCDDLQDKIDLVKGLRRKKKLKKRSMTRLQSESAVQEVPFISVRALPKKKIAQQATRLRQLQPPQNPTRAYVDPDTVEQHRMIGQVRDSQVYREPNQQKPRSKQPVTGPLQVKSRYRYDRADGDTTSRNPHYLEVACEADENKGVDTISIGYGRTQNKGMMDSKQFVKARLRPNPKTSSKKPVTVASVSQSEAPKWKETIAENWRTTTAPAPAPGSRYTSHQRTHVDYSNKLTTQEVQHKPERGSVAERGSVVEIFAKNRTQQKTEAQSSSEHRDASTDNIRSKGQENQRMEEESFAPDESTSQLRREKAIHRHPRRVKYRSRRYEMPTVSSQMKQAGTRYYCGSYNQTNIPFVVSKSTAPSHNIGVNIQQVLNGIKIQQPLSGIPFTIAHHMGLGHLPNNGKIATKTVQQPSLDNREMNVIRLGGRLVRLPSYKYISYNRLLALYREGNGMVSRFLRAISRPHYFYGSMYNLITRDDYDAATSKGRGAAQEAKTSLAEYASLYREYEQIEKLIKDGNYEPELERRKEELTRELMAREDHIRKVMQEYRAGDADVDVALRGSASAAGENYRHSSFKLNLADAHL